MFWQYTTEKLTSNAFFFLDSEFTVQMATYNTLNLTCDTTEQNT